MHVCTECVALARRSAWLDAQVVKVAAPIAYESVLNSLSTGSLQSHVLMKKLGVNAASGTPLASGIVWLIVAHAMIKIGAQSLQGMLDLSFNAAAQPAVRRIGTRTLGVLLSQELGFHLGMNTGATTRVVDRGMRGITAVLSRIVLQVCHRLDQSGSWYRV
jgi:hypothetical protein